ncbi:MAG: hypothetical protein A3H59_00035 [Candidatus Jacksonbacteria bacterium RIFCSPLOWO2_02_FULL_43_9]|nr:MAG: hypothetical protein UV70_C0008G0021 [Parcubacteria group bacterium GW2011_GWA2_43_13]OGY69533.1 MAG: hypothetical protein A3B94_03750 [Candidatus Jacksonbacteria bacterium RIFCSPHIGHO2_02_FULL_43_10]OGY70249.1 MAG: hypothetical protein A2986_04260 [Candidatus Jacksonbacteria bacterium RIFCSPLOWO2_01_FULL_44_13]OGY72535.1 MAG: hypothetical protein A3H59_00035 [Candidatus Jacksonbacteria bacterium RIFCSPLOWO2_02_FULL_43_9]HAZ16982.1 DUF3467 domain-containing protein [Candidatus Jacksonba
MENQQQIQIKITDDTLKGVYANSMQVAHTQEEFMIDFMNLFPPQGIVNARVILSPGHLKRMIAALQDNLKKYEQQFGEVTVAQQPAGESEIGFKAE